MNLSRLNHALFPENFAGRERLRRSWPARLAAPLVFLYTRLTMQGRMLLLLTLVVGAFGLQVETTDGRVLGKSIQEGDVLVMVKPTQAEVSSDGSAAVDEKKFVRTTRQNGLCMRAI